MALLQNSEGSVSIKVQFSRKILIIVSQIAFIQLDGQLVIQFALIIHAQTKNTSIFSQAHASLATLPVMNAMTPEHRHVSNAL